jgi:hypothetical protein
VYNKSPREIIRFSKNKNRGLKMKQTLYYGNVHVFSVRQQMKKARKEFIQKLLKTTKVRSRRVLAFVKESIEKNGDFFLNNGDF